MSQLTSAELALLRTQPHRTKFFLSIYQPDTVLACQVNDGSIAKGERVITYNNITDGSYLLVKRGMTLKVGSSAGDDNKGTVYVRSATSSTITVGENSHINWADDLYLTVIDFMQIWPIYPRFTSDGEDITVYKDYDVSYTDQNEVLGTLICMGPHHAGFAGDDVYYSATGTHYVGTVTGTSLSYDWHFIGGSPTGSTALTPGNVTYSAPGHYSTHLIVSGSSGFVEESRRHISIYDRPEDGTDVPILSWGFDGELAGDRDSGGYSLRVWVRENIGSIEDGALAIIFADDWYGNTRQSIGGNAENRSGIIFVGYIIGDSIDYDYQDSVVRFTISSPTELMKQVEAFSVSVEDSTNPSSDATTKGGDPWFYLDGLTMESALYHYIRWHSTINLCCDVQYDATNFNLQYFDADRSSLYDALNSLMESAVVGRVVCDRQGKIWCEIEYEAIDNAASALPLAMFIDNQDWIDTSTIQERKVNDLSFLEMGGIYWQGAVANTFSALIAAAPGEVPAYRGKPVRLHGLALSSQNQLNTLVGNVYANRNSRFPEVQINIAGNYRNFDIAPQERITLTMQNKTFRQLNWLQKSFAIRRVAYRMNQEAQFMNPSLVVSEIVQGFDADTILVPEVPPAEGFNPQPIIVPPFPEWPDIEIPTIPSQRYIWVPAVGGEYNLTTPLVYGGGPYCGGHFIEFTQAGISFNSDPYGHEFTAAFGAFIIPPGFTNFIAYPLWMTDDLDTFEWFGEIHGRSMIDGSSTSLYDYIEDTFDGSGFRLGYPFNPGESEYGEPISGDTEWVQMYVESSYNNNEDGCVWFFGWYVFIY